MRTFYKEYGNHGGPIIIFIVHLIQFLTPSMMVSEISLCHWLQWLLAAVLPFGTGVHYMWQYFPLNSLLRITIPIAVPGVMSRFVMTAISMALQIWVKINLLSKPFLEVWAVGSNSMFMIKGLLLMNHHCSIIVVNFMKLFYPLLNHSLFV